MLKKERIEIVSFHHHC